jgi:hypothetical protein
VLVSDGVYVWAVTCGMLRKYWKGDIGVTHWMSMPAPPDNVDVKDERKTISVTIGGMKIPDAVNKLDRRLTVLEHRFMNHRHQTPIGDRAYVATSAPLADYDEEYK